MKFKVGDKVRVIGKGNFCPYYYHKIYKVKSVTCGQLSPYKLAVPGLRPMFSARELEKVE